MRKVANEKFEKELDKLAQKNKRVKEVKKQEFMSNVQPYLVRDDEEKSNAGDKFDSQNITFKQAFTCILGFGLIVLYILMSVRR